MKNNLISLLLLQLAFLSLPCRTHSPVSSDPTDLFQKYSFTESSKGMSPALALNFKSDGESHFCDTNYDCIDTTFCCSTYSCVHPSMCLHGQKLHSDYCDYNFECLSRCCAGNKCSHFLQCYEKCNVNSDCKNTQCCTEGYCTH